MKAVPKLNDTLDKHFGFDTMPKKLFENLFLIIKENRLEFDQFQLGKNISLILSENNWNNLFYFNKVASSIMNVFLSNFWDHFILF